MTSNIDTTRYTVEELIQLWIQGDLAIEDGRIESAGKESLEVYFEGSDGTLSTHYTLAENMAHRTDTENNFNIMEADPDVSQKPLPARD